MLPEVKSKLKWSHREVKLNSSLNDIEFKLKSNQSERELYLTEIVMKSN